MDAQASSISSGNRYPPKAGSYPLVRGARDSNLTNLQEAANKIALFEEKVIYHGLPEANIKGLKMCKGATCLTMGSGPEQLLTAVPKGITTFAERSMEGPYAFVVGPKIWSSMSAHVQGYPVKMQAENVLGGSVLLSPYLSGHYKNEAYMVSRRGGDLEQILGQNLSIGHEKHAQTSVTLYITEFLTFRILEPAAVIHYLAR